MLKKNTKNYILPIIFIVLIAILKLNPYSTNAQVVKDIIRVKGSAFNLIPFATIMEYIINFNNYNTDIIIKFIILNFVLYMPLGILLNKDKIKNNNKINYLIIFLTPIIIELLQVIFKVGLFDIDSIILNLLGLILIYNLIKKNKKNVDY